MKGGGKVGVWAHVQTGKNLVTLANLDDIKPNEVYYLKTHKINTFHECQFSALCTWQQIGDMVKGGYLYVKCKEERPLI